MLWVFFSNAFACLIVLFLLVSLILRTVAKWTKEENENKTYIYETRSRGEKDYKCLNVRNKQISSDMGIPFQYAKLNAIFFF